MKSTVVYLGEEFCGTGFRLAGCSGIDPPPGKEVQFLKDAAAGADLLLLSAAFARRLPDGLLESYQSGLQPLVCVLPSHRGMLPAGEVVAEIRRFLGMEPTTQ